MYPLIIGTKNADTNITVVEINSNTKHIWLGGATYDGNLAGVTLNGAINEYVPYIAKYEFA